MAAKDYLEAQNEKMTSSLEGSYTHTSTDAIAMGAGEDEVTSMFENIKSASK